VGELAERYGRSMRQVERIFAERVGVSPKVYARLMRLKFGMRLGLAVDRPDWAGIAMEAGYFDQSHMVREFQAMNGATPVEFAELSRRAVEYRGMRGRLEDVAFVLSGAGDGL
jgi:transcriptional regulator GlxA family with amidase domain